MKALILDESKNVSIKETNRPKLEKNHVLVRVKAAALNHRELWISKGLYPGMKVPCILGADGTGIIEKIHTELIANSKLKEGDEVIIYPGYKWGDNDDIPKKQFRVLGMPDPGTIAEYISVPITHLVTKPSYLSWQEAAAIPVAYLTAWRALTRHGKIEKGSNVLITGIGGGVAQAGLAFALAHEANVYVTSSNLEKIEDAIEKGAKGGVNYKEPGWNLKLKSLADKIDIVLDSSPSNNLDDYLKFLSTGARIVYYGSTGSRYTTLNLSKFFLRHIQLIGTAMGSPREFEEMLSYMNNKQIKPTLYKEFDLDESAQALETLATGSQIGKIVINIS